MSARRSPETYSAIEELARRASSAGGFSPRPGLPSRPDATAWATLVLDASRTFPALAISGKIRLVREQVEDGSVPISADHPTAFWPTSLAVLAWNGSPAYREAQARAIQFLLETTGRHWKKSATDPFGHDTNLKGWSWTAGTHAWVEPTALAIVALTAAGYSAHPRVQEGIGLLLDRQLPHGGWNYGNTTVFHRELHPISECTGAALFALTGHVSIKDVQQSLTYLIDSVPGLRTPLAAGWALLGLQAWGHEPPGSEALVMETLNRRHRYGMYDTASLSVLLLAAVKGHRMNG